MTTLKIITILVIVIIAIGLFYGFVLVIRKKKPLKRKSVDIFYSSHCGFTDRDIRDLGHDIRIKGARVTISTDDNCQLWQHKYGSSISKDWQSAPVGDNIFIFFNDEEIIIFRKYNKYCVIAFMNYSGYSNMDLYTNIIDELTHI